ncbi:MAG: ATP-dependent DNA helicase RecG [Deltaproteobacteria bacterium]|nr:ATP-dependent DNA helicase RecG [Deltaproteobacteria bacterium]MBW2360469.1 ATP-dependent DNA helicase RecG [Deltaproteobacteria bacterium]
MPESPFQRALEAVLRPLEFAAADDFARLARVRDLPASVSGAARSASALALPADVVKVLTRVAEEFEAELDAQALRKAVETALGTLCPLAEPAWAEAALARGPEHLKGVGPKTAQALLRRGLASISDLLFHLPVRWDDRRSLKSVGELEVGSKATFVAQVLVADFVTRRGRSFRRSFEAAVGDASGSVTLKWFRGGESLAKQIQKDAWLLVTGDVKRYRFSKEIVHPEVELLAGPEDAQPADVTGLLSVVPEYPTPEGLNPRTLRRAVGQAVTQYADLVAGVFPADAKRDAGLPEPAEALRALHRPEVDADLTALYEGRHPARARLVLEELYPLEVGLALRRAEQGREPGIAIEAPCGVEDDVTKRLPFALTGAQERAVVEIRADLARPHPMNRLLEGDVGSGKTVVAFLAALAVTRAGCQSALMAPTELLAEQHCRTLQSLAAAWGDAAPRIALLTASLARAEAEAVRAQLAAGEIDWVVGTHALLQESVAFRRLAFVVVDEQHRFGVRQRAALVGKGGDGLAPHVLVMTATPIPRTLSLTVYGDLDLTVLDELPPGRTPVETLLMRPGEGQRVVDLLRAAVDRGEQAYVVYPLVEESEKVDLRAATDSLERLRRAFPDVEIGLVHGRLDAAERADVMQRFVAGEIQVLVSTTVIEVGLDVSNATLVVIEHAERFGLAQLHQLRGRVGRGERPGTCVLMARGVTEDSEARLAALLRTTDGFEIAEADLAIRGPGEFLGTRQHGRLLDLKLADLVRDARWVARAREAALATLRADPGLERDAALRRLVAARWGERLELAGIG